MSTINDMATGDSAAFNELDATSARPAGLREVEVDVRDDLRNGREPFSRIMATVDALQPGEALHLRAIFEPAPLFKVLGKRGFSHESLAHAPDDWSVWFWQAVDVAAPAAAADVIAAEPTVAEPTVAEPTTAQPGEHWLDVRGLEPPGPMLRTLVELETLPAGETLVQVNLRVPQFLLPILAERGFVATVDDTRLDRVLVRIRHGS